MLVSIIRSGTEKLLYVILIKGNILILLVMFVSLVDV